MLRFVVNVSGKTRDVFFRYDSVFHNLRKSGDRRQRRLELMGNVRNEFRPELFAAVLFGNIHQNEDRSGLFFSGKDGRCDNLQDLFSDPQLLFVLRPFQRLIRSLSETAAAVKRENMASVRRRRDFQQLRYRVIVADHLALHVEHDNTFAHIVCYGLEILLPAL